MKHSSLKAAGIAGALFLTSFSYGQVKELGVPNLKNPFQAKSKQEQTAFTDSDKQAYVNRPRPAVKVINGSFSANLQKYRVTKESVVISLNGLLHLNENHSFQQLTENKDELGFTHTSFRQLYKGLPVEGQHIFLHSKDELMTSINGQVVQDIELNTQASISTAQAAGIAKREAKVTALIQEYPVETLVARVYGDKGLESKLVYKVRIDSYAPLVLCHVYVDAKTGTVVNKVNLLAHADTPGTGQTYYSGAQSITADSYNGSYRLRENGRRIQTYNATNADENFTTSGFTNSEDFTSPSSTFSGVATLQSMHVAAISQSWWYNSLSDQSPDLYIVVKDGSNQIVYTSNISYDVTPPLTLNNLNIMLTNPPYKVELWDYDSGTDDDFGGTYNITATAGTQNWTGNGNNGTYAVSTTGNPGVDVHWGMEKSYDFYKNVFNRNSYDGAGSVIKQYVNPPILQAQYGSSPNNAGAFPAPYNFMVYGLGDGIYMNPVVGLDVEGHEFTHMVVANNGHGGLVYQGESGALNESFADIFGVCIEFYSGVNADWLMGEDIMVSEPFLRSMSNPNGGDQPDTYNGVYWVNPANTYNDHGGVHTNSGVQNFWFYLLCQGGTGTNDNGDTYSVTGIGIADARAIAYRNLMNYLGPNATFMDAYNGSLQAAQDLFGSTSTQYTAVREAWYAVGVGNTPMGYCSGTTDLRAASGTITDGSGAADYNDQANCTWMIAPEGATRISLSFTTFRTESGYDYVTVYNGPDNTYPVLGSFSGTNLPSTVNTSAGVGAMCVEFTSDISLTDAGWSANYTSTIVTPSCSGGSILSTPTGSFTDGSGSGNYGNNQACVWYIAPPCVSSITLSLSQLDTELNHDGIVVFDDYEGNNMIALISGTSIPPSVTSTTGRMMVVFFSDHTVTRQGFSASYTSTGGGYCSGTTVLSGADEGTFTDGSGANNYCDNTDCRWMIQPLTGNVTLHFTAFDLESAALDGQTIYDVVEVYDGSTTNDPLLGRFAGSSLPPSVTSTSGTLLVRFKTDFSLNRGGWSAYYTTTQSITCNGLTTLTAPSGTFSDGSGGNEYANNTHCTWLIQPNNAQNITLTFSAFDTESYYDGVLVYDGVNNSANLLGQFSGSSIPMPVTSGGKMFVEFVSDPSVRQQGWTASYSSDGTTGIGDAMMKQNLEIFPNPTEGVFTVHSELEQDINIQVMDMLGKQVLEISKINKGINQIDASEWSKGIYLVRFTLGDKSYVEKLVVE